MEYKLEDLFTLRKEKFSNGLFLIVNGDDFVSNSPHKLANYNYAEFPNKKLQKSGYNQLFQKGDILFLTVGAKKKIWLADQEGICASGNNKIKIIIAKKNIIFPQFLINILTSEKITRWAFDCLTGTTVPQIDWKVFARKKLIVPSLSEQQKKLDTFLPLENYWRKTDELVKKMKNLINSILRFLLPKDRETRKLGEIAKFQYGYTATASEQGEFRYIRITDIDEFGNISDKEKKYVDLPTDINQEKYLLKKNDVLVTRTGSYGKTTIFTNSEKSIFASYLIRINLNKEIISPRFYWYFSQTQEYWEQANNLVGGTAQPQFNANSLKKIMVPILGVKEQKKIVIKLDEEAETFLTTFYSYRLSSNVIKKILDLYWEKETIKLIKFTATN